VAGPELVVHRTPVGFDLVGPGAPAAATELERAGVERSPAERWELARVAGGLPRAGHELTDDVLAEEAGLLGSHVHMDKGCYPGQETVARVHNLGQVQRRLAGLVFQPSPNGGGDGLPTPRTDLVTDDGRRAGQLRSVVDHPVLGPIGLAYVRRVVETGRLVRAGDRVATVVDLPFE
jgi:folate-binding protein YgfZ